MDSGQPLQVRIQLPSIEELFSPPAQDPLAGKLQMHSGIERAVRQIEDSRPSLRTGELIIVLPPDAIVPGLDVTVRDAIANYCQSHIAEERHSRARTLRDGRLALRIGVPFLAACLLVSGAVRTANAGNGLLGQLVSESLVIAGWVGLWRPAELLLYEWRPFQRRAKALEALTRMGVRLEAAGRA